MLTGLARRLWLALRAAVELFVPRPTLDRGLDAVGFFALKDRLQTRRRSLPGGAVLYFRPDDEKILAEVYEQGIYDPLRVEEGSVVVDVGSHIGAFAVRAARAAGKGRVVCVEPAPANLALLRRNLAANGLGNVTVRACALSDAAGELELVSQGDHAMYTLHPPAGGTLRTKVPVRTLDELCAELGVTAIDALKVDVERAELEVLKGGRGILRRTAQAALEVSKDSGLPEAVRAELERAGLSWRVLFEDAGAELLYAWRPPA